MFINVTNYDRYNLINLLASYGIKEPLLSLLDRIPREIFVDKKNLLSAYEDRALPIGQGQTISQPSLVAIMLQTLDLKGDEKVLEVGTGSGYQTALLSHLASEVYSIERIKQFIKPVAEKLRRLKIKNVHLIAGDGTKGFADKAPYDAIVVSAAFISVPPSYFAQLKEGGKLLMPIGSPGWQNLMFFKKIDGKFKEEKNLMKVSFVPLIAS